MTGKEKCERLRKVRNIIAESFGIEYHETECPHVGDCTGTCPQCDAEIQHLEAEINRLRREGQELREARAREVFEEALNEGKDDASAAEIQTFTADTGLMPRESNIFF